MYVEIGFDYTMNAAADGTGARCIGSDGLVTGEPLSRTLLLCLAYNPRRNPTDFCSSLSALAHLQTMSVSFPFPYSHAPKDQK